MLLAYLLICQLTTSVIGNPFHKYPFVFLLDIGNEELEKTNTEQIRISAPGGSLALRYPAAGAGDTISHVRVSGIDFGTDLKANIVDGGPGSKYVVLAFSGNAGVPYDAVLTVQTLSDDMADNEQIPESVDGNVAQNDLSNDTPSSDVADNGDEEYDDNVSKEILSDQSSNIKNAEIVQQQSASNDFNYSENQVLDNDDYNDEEQNEDADGRKDIHNLYRQIYERYNQNKVRDYNPKGEVSQASVEDSYSSNSQSKDVSGEPKAEPYSVNNGFVNEDFTGEDQIGVVDNNLYDKYKALKPHLYNNVRVYPQEAVHDAEIANSRNDFNTGEDPVEIDQMFNDEEIHNDADKFKDTNNNYFDSDDSSAVAY
ncbi:hypothetical protein EVAR_70128_1 [Eumeta japonica]|uniref:Uncharacterized protein n=1 Tax=Eumeta variegata TaxID=151549 RepID=A0A4C1Z8Y6_EUMVA|nr:hypothetical protein EVAR_70128_1 [Eumeta japonica]